MRIRKNTKDGIEKQGIGNVFKLIRIAMDLSVKEVAEQLGVSSAYICEIEANNKKPSMAMIEKYCNFFEISKSTLFLFEEEGNKINYDYQKLLLQILQSIVDIPKEDDESSIEGNK